MKRTGKIEAAQKGYAKTKRVNGEPIHCIWMIKPQDERDGFEQVGMEDKDGNACPF